MTRFERYVAIGDSTSEGLDDPDGAGGYRGWANRLADRLATNQGSVLYANLAVRGLTTRQILERQLAPALELRPDLATVVSGTNDLLRKQFDPDEMGADVERMQRALIGIGATVLSFTLPDLTGVMPLAKLLRPRLRAMNQSLRDASSRSGAILCDFSAHPVASDRRLWSADRLHANSAGHARIAEALAWHLALPGATSAWSEALSVECRRTPLERARLEASWIRGYLLPWLWRHARGRSSGDGVSAKQPLLTCVRAH